jgi:hypothetical protein
VSVILRAPREMVSLTCSPRRAVASASIKSPGVAIVAPSKAMITSPARNPPFGAGVPGLDRADQRPRLSAGPLRGRDPEVRVADVLAVLEWNELGPDHVDRDREAHASARVGGRAPELVGAGRDPIGDPDHAAV